MIRTRWTLALAAAGVGLLLVSCLGGDARRARRKNELPKPTEPKDTRLACGHRGHPANPCSA